MLTEILLVGEYGGLENGLCYKDNLKTYSFIGYQGSSILTYNIDESVISTRPHKFVVVKPLNEVLLMNALMQAFNHAVLYFSKAMLMNIPGYKLKAGNSQLYKYYFDLSSGFTDSTGIKIQIDVLSDYFDVPCKMHFEIASKLRSKRPCEVEKLQNSRCNRITFNFFKFFILHRIHLTFAIRFVIAIRKISFVLQKSRKSSAHYMCALITSDTSFVGKCIAIHENILLQKGFFNNAYNEF
ncbi:hypothetical protein T4D_6326 [Trichinella pseudospiralis]|uniref:Uncharacterized protein n=1 Tax=Trichinella pseudospiralis TaxID=6337 RepID=A0A0V1FXG7_TRIPS|nr:hypothetical protein T4D_6326 [Trichinella pseudospiralis]